MIERMSFSVGVVCVMMLAFALLEGRKFVVRAALSVVLGVFWPVTLLAAVVIIYVRGK